MSNTTALWYDFADERRRGEAAGNLRRDVHDPCRDVDVVSREHHRRDRRVEVAAADVRP